MSKDSGAQSPVRCSIAPLLSVRNGARAVEFYKSAFGAVEVYRVEDPDGAVVSRLSIDGAAFWLSGESPEHGIFKPESSGGGSVRMILTVEDPDTVVAQAVAAGARQTVAVEENYGVAPGSRDGSVRPRLGDRPSARFGREIDSVETWLRKRI